MRSSRLRYKCTPRAARRSSRSSSTGDGRRGARKVSTDMLLFYISTEIERTDTTAASASESEHCRSGQSGVTWCSLCTDFHELDAQRGHAAGGRSVLVHRETDQRPGVQVRPDRGDDDPARLRLFHPGIRHPAKMHRSREINRSKEPTRQPPGPVTCQSMDALEPDRDRRSCAVLARSSLSFPFLSCRVET